MYWTSCYAAILGLIYIKLSLDVIRMRNAKKISLGSAKDKELKQKIRAHGNFIEYVPFSLILLFLAENNAAGYILVHSAGLCLLLGRILHAYSFTRVPPRTRYRVLGMQFTFFSIMLGSVANLYILFLGHI